MENFFRIKVKSVREIWSTKNKLKIIYKNFSSVRLNHTGKTTRPGFGHLQKLFLFPNDTCIRKIKSVFFLHSSDLFFVFYWSAFFLIACQPSYTIDQGRAVCVKFKNQIICRVMCNEGFYPKEKTELSCSEAKTITCKSKYFFVLVVYSFLIMSYFMSITKNVSCICMHTIYE